MALITSIWTCSTLTWLDIVHDYANRRCNVRMKHRGVYIRDYICLHDNGTLNEFTDFVIKKRREIDYYFDAIWC
jgi:hypothetical protein